MSDPMQNLNAAADALNQVAARAGAFWDDADAQIAAGLAQMDVKKAELDTWRNGALADMRNRQHFIGGDTYAYDDNGTTAYKNHWTKFSLVPGGSINSFASFRLVVKGDNNGNANVAHVQIDWSGWTNGSQRSQSIDVDVFAGAVGVEFYFDPAGNGDFYVRRIPMWSGVVAVWLEFATNSIQFNIEKLKHTEVAAALETDLVTVTKAAPFTSKIVTNV